MRQNKRKENANHYYDPRVLEKYCRIEFAGRQAGELIAKGEIGMTESDYKYLQERLSKKSENNPYKYTGCFNYETGYKEGIAAAKSILFEFYHRRAK